MQYSLSWFRRLTALVSSRVHSADQAKIDYLREEVRVLKRVLGDRRVRFTEGERVRLATKARRLGSAVMRQLASIVQPDTLLAWHRRLVARAKPRPRPRDERWARIRELVVRLAKENPRWGYGRIQGALKGVGIRVACTTVRRILQRAGVEPPPARGMSWRSLVRAHADVTAAADFFTVRVWTLRGLVTKHVLFVIDVATRAVEISGITSGPNAAFVEAIARRWAHAETGILRKKRRLIVDRDKKFTLGFRRILESAGVAVMRTAPRAPNMNAFAERFVHSVRSECLDHLILIGEGALRRALQEYLAHYNEERHHQGIGNELIAGDPPPTEPADRIATCRRLGGLLNYYHPAAAA